MLGAICCRNIPQKSLNSSHVAPDPSQKHRAGGYSALLEEIRGNSNLKNVVTGWEKWENVMEDGVNFTAVCYIIKTFNGFCCQFVKSLC